MALIYIISLIFISLVFHDSTCSESSEVIALMHLTSSSPQVPDWRERSKKRHASQAPWRGMEFVYFQTVLSSIRSLHLDLRECVSGMFGLELQRA